MIAVNNKIIVSVEQGQKDFVDIGGNRFRMALNYGTNYRVKAPTIATVVEGNDLLQSGDVLLCHHNLYYLPSPYHLSSNLFSVPFSKVLFAKILGDGSLLPICGNILGERIEIPTSLPLPPDQVKMYNDRLLVTNAGYTKYKKGQLLFCRPSSCYSIIYHWNLEQKEVVKISDDMVCGILR